MRGGVRGIADTVFDPRHDGHRTVSRIDEQLVDVALFAVSRWYGLEHVPGLAWKATDWICLKQPVNAIMGIHHFRGPVEARTRRPWNSHGSVAESSSRCARRVREVELCTLVVSVVKH